MSSPIRDLLKKTLIATRLLPLFSIWQLKKTYLDPLGWSRSILSQSPIDQTGTPQPWMNYNIISLLKERDIASSRILEYGSGGSTHWWSKRSSFVLSIEHDSFWFQKCKDSIPSNVELRLAPNSEQYPLTATPKDGPFDIIVIDAIHRVECASYAQEILSERGVIIWDDSERPEYELGQKSLINKNFRRIRFFGVKPGASKPAATDIYYRDNNILGI